MREAMRKARRHACMSDRLTNAVTPSTKYEVRDADAILTIIPEGSAPSPGTTVGLDEGELLSKPMYTAAGLSDVPDIINWIKSLPDETELCIGGPRASECPRLMMWRWRYLKGLKKHSESRKLWVEWSE